MSKLNLDAAVPRSYDSAVFTGIIRAICQQVNLESEGRLAARYQAQASVPSSVAAAVGDIVWDSNVTVTSGTARLGWVCNVASPTNATWQEIRVLTASGQYAFPSTQTPSSDPNTLDDYEEGTWTPSVGGTATYTTQSGTYTKVGRLVTVEGRLVINAIGTGSTGVISGLPFTAANVSAISVGYFANSATNYTWLGGFANASQTTINLTATAAAAASVTNPAVFFANSADIIFSASYIV